MINMLHIFQDFVIMLFLHAQNRRPNLLKAYACARKNGKIFRWSMQVDQWVQPYGSHNRGVSLVRFGLNYFLLYTNFAPEIDI